MTPEIEARLLASEVKGDRGRSVKQAFLSLLYIVVVPLQAQMPHHHDSGAPAPKTAELIAQARQATEVFRDRSVAISRGYRLVGRDLPMMGEHRLNVPFHGNIFAAENWALSFVHAGLEVPDHFPTSVARSVRKIVSGVRNHQLQESDLTLLAEVWKRLVEGVKASSGIEAAKRIQGQ